MKIMIECLGGVISNIVATDEISIHIVDHDNLKCSSSDEAKETMQAQQPNLICDEEEYQEQLESTLHDYTEPCLERNKKVDGYA